MSRRCLSYRSRPSCGGRGRIEVDASRDSWKIYPETRECRDCTGSGTYRLHRLVRDLLECFVQDRAIAARAGEGI